MNVYGVMMVAALALQPEGRLDLDLGSLDRALARSLRDADTLLEQLETEGADSATVAAAWGRMGNVLQFHELLPEARRCYEAASGLAPGEDKWTYFLGLIAIQEADYVEAVHRFEAVVARQPDHLPSLLRLGAAHLKLAQPDAASTRFRQAATLDPTSAAAHCGQGEVALQTRDWQGAIEALDRCLKLQPSATRVHAQLAQAHRLFGNAEKAGEHAIAYGAAPVSFADPWQAELSAVLPPEVREMQGGVQALNEGRTDQAMGHFLAVVAHDPRHPEALRLLGGLLHRRGETQRGLRYLERALETDPESRAVRQDLATLQEAAGDYAGAASQLEWLWKRDPDDQASARRLGQALARAGRHDELLDLYPRWIARWPQAIEFRMAYAGKLFELGQPSQAAAQLEEVVALDPRRPEAYQGLATGQILAGEWRQARSTLETGVMRIPTHLALRHSLAQVLAASNDPSARDGQRALELAQAVFDEQPSRPHAETLAMAYAESGAFDKAAEWQAKLISDTPTTNAGGWRAQALARLQMYRNGMTVNLLEALPQP